MPIWRSRFFLRSFAELPSEIMLDKAKAKAQTTPLEEDHTGRLTSLLDLYLERPTIKEAYFESLDTANTFTDAVAFLSFAPASVEIISVTTPSSLLNIPFDMVVPLDGYKRNRVLLSQEKLLAICRQTNKDVSIALRSFRSGLSADSPYRILTELWTGIETLAKAKAKTENKFVITKCPKCEESWPTTPATQQYIRRYFESAKPDDKTKEEYKRIADDTRSLRSSLAHGGKLQNPELRERVDLRITSLQAAAAISIIEEIGIKPESHRCQHLGVPFMHVKLIRTGPSPLDCKLDNSLEVDVPTQVSGLPDRYSERQRFVLDVGIYFPFPIHPLGLPDPAISE